jgi:hypothetical protein
VGRNGHHTPKAGFLYLRDEHAIVDGAVNDDAIGSIKSGVHRFESQRRFVVKKRKRRGYRFTPRLNCPAIFLFHESISAC